MRASILIAVSGLALLGCNSNKSTPENVPPNELQSVMAEDGNPDYHQLTAKLLAKQPVVEGLDYAKAVAELTPPTTLDPWATKVEVDDRLTARNGGQPLLYNRDYPSLAGPLKQGRMQCFSGSMLNLLVQRQKPQAEFNAAKPVMIFTPGHILPGYVVGENLVGVETTVIGRGRTDFGPLAKLAGPIRVVDAEAFVQMYVYQSKLKDVPAMVQILLKQTADRYGIPLARTEAGIDKGALTIAADAPLNRSAFGFGKDTDISEAGDKPRAFADDIKPQNGYTNRAVISGEALGSTGAMSVGVIAAPEMENVHSLELELLPGYPRLQALCEPDRMIIALKNRYLEQVERLWSEVRSIDLDFGPTILLLVPAKLTKAGQPFGLGEGTCEVLDYSGGARCSIWSKGAISGTTEEGRLSYFSIRIVGRRIVGFTASRGALIDDTRSTPFEMEHTEKGTDMFLMWGQDRAVEWKDGHVTFNHYPKEGRHMRETHAAPSICAPVISSEPILYSIEAMLVTPTQKPPTAETPASAAE